MAATRSNGLQMLFPNLAGNLLQLLNGQTVQLVGVGDFTQVHTGTLAGLFLD